ncbi:MAG: hypothetical protein M1820_004529 [Bogoriella megaspora]|nr:MAG: hypothetical protein M1820_004529 [Bogoriella megaspora]
METSPRSAKRRKLDTPAKTHAKTPPKGKAIQHSKTGSSKRRSRRGQASSGEGSESTSVKPTDAHSKNLKQFSDAVKEFRYGSAEASTKTPIQVAETDEVRSSNSKKQTRNKITRSSHSRGELEDAETGRLDIGTEDDSGRIDSSAQLIAEDGAISGLGGKTNGDISPEADYDQELDNQADIEQPRSSGRQRRKSQKVLEQETSVESATKKSKRRNVKAKLVEATGSQEEIKAANSSAINPERNDVLEDQAFHVPEQEAAAQNVAQPQRLPGRGRKRTGKEILTKPSSTSSQRAVNGTQKQDAQSDATDMSRNLELIEQSVESALSPPVTSEATGSIEVLPPIESLKASQKDLSVVQNMEISEDQKVLLQTIVMERMTGRRPVPVTNLDDEYAKVHSLLHQTVVAGEGNSLLIIGARGTGKTTLVNQAIRDLAPEHSDNFHVIRLNGFIHTDDKLALREIWRQLGREMEFNDEDEAMSKSYADTLATLLALLSHPSELSGQDTKDVAKSVIFVIDEFDLFAMHPRQTLLYNLFDIAQSRKAPIAVLGLTTRLDIAEGLEKRVKSRWSHRYVHIPQSKSFAAFQQVCKAALTIQPDQISPTEKFQLTSTPTEVTPSSKKRKKGASKLPPQDILTAWNFSIEALFSHPPFQSHLTRLYNLSKSIPTFLTSLLPALSQLSTSSFPPAPSSFLPTTSTHLPLTPPDSPLHLLPSLSTLSLALLIAAARLEIIHETPSTNFNLAYAEYVSLAAKSRVQQTSQGALAYSGGGGGEGRVWGRGVAWGEWLGLVGCGLLVPVLGERGGMMLTATVKDGSEMVRCDVGLEEIGLGMPDMGGTLGRWCKEI